MPRKSSASLEISRPVVVTNRPDAPYDLTDEQSEEWWAVVNRMPAEWFPRETHALLAQYCRHVVAARRISQLITALEGEISKKANPTKAAMGAVGQLDKLLHMQEREGRAMSLLATRMRLTQHSTYDAKKKKPDEPAALWDD